MEKNTAIWSSMVAVLACYGLFFSSGALAETAEKDSRNTKKITVNCNNKNPSVQKAINKIKPGQPGIIYIKGFCEAVIKSV